MKNLLNLFVQNKDLLAKKETIINSSPSGAQQPVLVIPGFTLNDFTTRNIRDFLSEKGYSAYSWNAGVNTGPSKEKMDLLCKRLDEVFATHKQKVSLVGFSLGGLYARELSRKYPDKVSQVITIASPFGIKSHSKGPMRTVRKLSEYFNKHASDMSNQELLSESLKTLPVPTTAIYSKQDRIADWKTCINTSSKKTENVEVSGGHIEMLNNPAVYLVLADRLSQKARSWSPFDQRKYKDHINLFPQTGSINNLKFK